MSRHRDIRNLNIHDELDDDALSDGGEEDMTQEQIEQMHNGLDQVHRVLGGEGVSGITDREIKEALWEYYFDVQKTIDWAMEEQERRVQQRERRAAKEREKAQKKLAQQKISGSTPSSASTSRTTSPIPSLPTPKVSPSSKASKKSSTGPQSGPSSPTRKGNDQRIFDLAAMNLTSNEDDTNVDEAPPQMSYAKEKLVELAKKVLETGGDAGKFGINLVVIGHVDAGKSTLMGRLLYELGRMDEKTRSTNERGSNKIGKGSFSWAWGLDGTTEERERGITMDIAQRALTTSHRQITILDAPGHKDFIPNMISGASQADCALLVVDASVGEFEAGFDRGGQTREHLVLVRSLGVAQVVVAINKLDQVDWDKGRYQEICELLKQFLLQSGFQPSKTKFAPVGAMQGVNLAGLEGPDSQMLAKWYKGPTLVDYLDMLEPPTRDITGPVRIPISNVYRSQVTGRLCSGIVQVGERLRVLPGDETCVVKSIELEDENVPWAMAGSNINLSLTSIDPVHLNIGNVLCPPSAPIPLATVFSARVIVFDIQVPIISGASVELFQHSRDVPGTITKLLCTLDRATGKTVKANPRVLSKGTSAEIQITLRSGSTSGMSAARPIPLEPFSVNKDMGRILIRRGGETIAAGIVLESFG